MPEPDNQTVNNIHHKGSGIQTSSVHVSNNDSMFHPHQRLDGQIQMEQLSGCHRRVKIQHKSFIWVHILLQRSSTSCASGFADSHWRLHGFQTMLCFLVDHKVPVWNICNLISMLKMRILPNKEQSESARGAQLYLQTALMSSTLAGAEIEQMDDKSVSNEGKLTARCRCQCCRGSGVNLFISVFTVDRQSAAGRNAGKTANRQGDQSEM